MAQGQRITTPYDDLTYKIIGCAMTVHRKLGPSHREDVNQRDLQEYRINRQWLFIPDWLKPEMSSPPE